MIETPPQTSGSNPAWTTLTTALELLMCLVGLPICRDKIKYVLNVCVFALLCLKLLKRL